MPEYPSFEAVLAQALGEEPHGHDSATRLGTTPWLPVTRAARRGLALEPSRPRRHLARPPAADAGTPWAAALASFTRRGVRLTPTFTTGELRRAYRALARTLHPDRYPGLGPADRARMTDEFAEVASHYRLLRLHAIDAR